MSLPRPVYPFSALVGQDRLKRALEASIEKGELEARREDAYYVAYIARNDLVPNVSPAKREQLIAAGGLIGDEARNAEDDFEGPHKGVFTVKRSGDFDITDGAFLPDGDLLLLERSFTMAEGVKMRLRRIYGEEIALDAEGGAVVLVNAVVDLVGGVEETDDAHGSIYPA